MKIRFVHQYFHPDLSSVSRVISEIAFALAASGHEVSVVCSRNKYDGALKETLPPKERIRGVDIQRCWGLSFGRRTLKQLSLRLPCRPLLVFFYLYLVRFGFLDGMPGYHFCRLRMTYESMIDHKVKELRGIGLRV